MKSLFIEIRKLIGWLFIGWGFKILPDSEDKNNVADALTKAILKDPLFKK